MLYREKIAVCSEIHMRHTKTLCRQNVELLNVKTIVTYSKQHVWNTYVNETYQCSMLQACKRFLVIWCFRSVCNQTTQDTARHTPNQDLNLHITMLQHYNCCITISVM